MRTSPIVGKNREAENNDESLILENQGLTDGIANLRKFECRTGNLPFRNPLNLQDAVNDGYAGMKLSLAQVDNTPKTYQSGKQDQAPISLMLLEGVSNLPVQLH